MREREGPVPVGYHDKARKIRTKERGEKGGVMPKEKKTFICGV